MSFYRLDLTCYWWEDEQKKRAHRATRQRRLAEARSRGTHSAAEWLALVEEFNGKCVRCLRSNMRLDKDHIIPLYREDLKPTDSIENLQPLCPPCNTSKKSNFNYVKHLRRNREQAVLANAIVITSDMTSKVTSDITTLVTRNVTIHQSELEG